MRALPALLGLALASAGGGCAFPHAIGDIAMDYNAAVARTSDELTLLNIVRARERQPLHFTAISALRGNISVGASVSADAVLPNKDANVYSGGTSLNVQSGPSFDVAVLNSQEFQRGVLQPVTPQLLDYFLEQGWPRDFITALFVERVEYRAARAYPDHYAADDVIQVIDNRPDRAADSAAFGQLLQCYALRAVAVQDADVPIVAYDDLKDRSTLGDLGALAQSKLDIRILPDATGTPRRMIVRVGGSHPGLALTAMDESKPECGLAAPDTATPGRAVAPAQARITLSGFRLARDQNAPATASREAPSRESIGQVAVRNGQGVLTRDGQAYDVTTQIVLRSPIGVIYFLGEYARAADPYLVRGAKLIDIRDGATPDAFVTTKLGAAHYSIATHDSGRSLQTLSIVEQMVNLQKSASELPSTGAVQVVR